MMDSAHQPCRRRIGLPKAYPIFAGTMWRPLGKAELMVAFEGGALLEILQMVFLWPPRLRCS